ncbi:MAG TPA: BsuPI-related putative proteinase inhibitor [Actinomycetota bacterium]|nr:BsuPI-related putative proteinase inhibitor [Actinomycetota bacterium]
MPFAAASRLALASLVALPLSVATAPDAAPAPRRCTAADLSVRLRVDGFRFDRGERVRMKMTTKNVSKLRCKMVFGSGNRGTLVIRREDGGQVWWDENCMAYTDAIVEERWRAGHRETYRGAWNQRKTGDRETCEHDGPRARPGLYFARGLFDGAGDVRSNRVWFRLRK